jgi:hypothetical protein
MDVVMDTKQSCWWKEATITLAPHVRPWDMANVSRFCTNIKVLILIFQSSIKFQLGQGTTIYFWHDDWLQGAFKSKFPHVYQHVRYKDGSIVDFWQMDQWQFNIIGLLDEQGRDEMMLLQHKLSFVNLVHNPDESIWLRHSSG